MLSICLSTFGIFKNSSSTAENPTPANPSPQESPVDSPPKPNGEISPEPSSTPTLTPQVDRKQELKTQLETQLKNKNWKDADKTTYNLMLVIAGENSSQAGNFDFQEWNNFSCEELRYIDNQWKQASNGRLGFSVQRKIFEEVGRNAIKFYETIGWKEPNSNEWKVAWEYNPQSKQAEYRPGKEPNYNAPPLGTLPAMLEWQEQSDLRFEAIYRCGL